MELYYVMSILDRPKREEQERIYRGLGLKTALTMLGRGTAAPLLLRQLGLAVSEKAILATFADKRTADALFRQNKLKLFIDIPGNGVMLSIPIKSVGGSRTLSILTDNKPLEPGKPGMTFEHELIYVILNEGHSDEVMDAARPAGAAGGTVISAKGTGIQASEKFRELTLASEKEVVLIIARAQNKAEIMRAIMEKAGPGTPAGAICFSMPVTRVAGLRRLEEDDTEQTMD